MTTTTKDYVAPLLKGALLPALIVGAATITGAAVLAGSPGAIGAALGVLIVVMFSGTGLLAMRLVRAADALTVTAVGMGSYALRVVLFGATLIGLGALGVDAWLNRAATAVAVMVTMVAWLVGEVRAFTRLRIPTYDIEPDLGAAEDEPEGSR